MVYVDDCDKTNEKNEKNVKKYKNMKKRVDEYDSKCYTKSRF